MAVPKKSSLPRPSATTPPERRSRATATKQPDRLISRARRKFLRHFPKGFRDETYLDWERDYKWNAHLRWQDNLSEASFRRLLAYGRFDEIAKRASAIEFAPIFCFPSKKWPCAMRSALRLAHRPLHPPCLNSCMDQKSLKFDFQAGAFFDGLADAGYKDGSTMSVVFRTAEGNMSLMPELIKNVLAEKVDYLVVSTSPGVQRHRRLRRRCPCYAFPCKTIRSRRD